MTQHDQAGYWNDPAVASHFRELQTGVTDFAKQVQSRVASHTRILELGCGAGDDAAYFAENGHDVLATDVSEPLLDMASQRYADLPNLVFRHIDMSQPFEVGGQSCDVAYARLSLHYFDDKTTMSLFSEIAWVLRPGGRLFFMCRSVDDPAYGQGTQLGPDYFDNGDHVRHFFSDTYTRELLQTTGFRNIEIDHGTEKLYGQPSAYLACSAIR